MHGALVCAIFFQQLPSVSNSSDTTMEWQQEANSIHTKYLMFEIIFYFQCFEIKHKKPEKFIRITGKAISEVLLALCRRKKCQNVLDWIFPVSSGGRAPQNNAVNISGVYLSLWVCQHLWCIAKWHSGKVQRKASSMDWALIPFTRTQKLIFVSKWFWSLMTPFFKGFGFSLDAVVLN